MERLDVVFRLEKMKQPARETVLKLMGMGGPTPEEMILDVQALEAAINDVLLLERLKEKKITIEQAEKNTAALHSLQEKVIMLQAVAGLTIEDLTARIKAERRMQMRRPPVTDRPIPGENHD